MRFPAILPDSTARVDAAAADWLARRDAGLKAGEEIQFQQWLAADARHGAAWREIDSTWRVFDGPRHRGDAVRMIRELTTRRRRRHRQRILVGCAAGAVAALAAIVLISRVPSPPTLRQTNAVAVSKPERRQLVDGSVVELNTGAQIAVNFSGARRDVRLLRGEAHFAVAKDPSRPFVVTTIFGEARAVGTAFSVGLQPQAMAVLVTEGTVAVGRPAAMTPRPIPVPAGNAVVVPAIMPPDFALHVETVGPGEMESRLAWRAPRLELANTPLSAVVAALNRENRVQLAIADAALGGLRLTGVFRADRAEEFARLLEAHYGVRAERRGANAITLHSEP